MYFRVIFALAAIFVSNGKFCAAASDDFPRTIQSAESDQSHLILDQTTYNQQRQDNNIQDSNSTAPSRRLITASTNPPEPVSRLSTAPPTPPEPVTMSMHSATFTFPPIPSAATATASPGGNDLSKITHLLFAILLVVTAILLVMLGVCMVDLRRRYLGISKPCYNTLKSVPV